jgi:hypothetical protein
VREIDVCALVLQNHQKTIRTGTHWGIFLIQKLFHKSTYDVDYQTRVLSDFLFVSFCIYLNVCFGIWLIFTSVLNVLRCFASRFRELSIR